MPLPPATSCQPYGLLPPYRQVPFDYAQGRLPQCLQAQTVGFVATQDRLDDVGRKALDFARDRLLRRSIRPTQVRSPLLSPTDRPR